MRITLTVTSGPHQGKLFSFENHDTFLVGRGKRAHFRLPFEDKYFSRIHFMVEVNPPQCRLLDMGSTNGTFVNGQKVTTVDLRHGDQIKGGDTVIAVRFEETGSEPGPAPDTPEVPPSTLLPAEANWETRDPTPAPASSMPAAPGATDSCRVCAAPLSKSAAPDSANGQFLCQSCREVAGKQPQPIAGYQIIKELGRGGMGVVHLGLRSSDGVVVALKTIIPAVAGTKAQVERFLREANILRELTHPNIVAFREMGESSGKLYFAMDFVKGTDAAGLLKKQGPLPVPLAVSLACQMLEALEYAHARKFVHRDLKPANILVTAASEDPQTPGAQVKLADFGLARSYQCSQLSGLTLAGELGGTLAFMPPEQITHYREAKPPVDQYAAAASLYNLLTDRLIFNPQRTLQEQIAMILQEKPVPIQSRRADIPKELAAVIHRALEREPGDRFADVKAMRLALAKFCPS